MKVIRSAIMGFCMGVRRAVETARQAAREDGAVYTLGPLIHNPGVLADLRKRGVGILDEGDLPSGPPENSTVIIRAHGVPPETEDSLRRQGYKILDATCPRVKANQKKAREYASRRYRIFLAGEENHGEIVGIRGYAESVSGAPCIVAGNADEAESKAAGLYKTGADVKTALLAQTTISYPEFLSIGEAVKKYFPALVILDTICGATSDRQEALRTLCGKVDAVVVAGGKKSANTRRLLALAFEMGKPAWIVELPAELPAEIRAYKTAGLCAGASTPDEVIDEIEEELTAY